MCFFPANNGMAVAVENFLSIARNVFSVPVEDSIIAAVFAMGPVVDPYTKPLEIALSAGLNATLPMDVFYSWVAKIESPHVKHLPLMNPVHALLAVILYSVVIFAGSQIMKGFNKFTLKSYSWLHNLILTALSLYTAVKVVLLSHSNGIRIYAFLNNVNHSPSGLQLAKVCWLFYFAKFPELLDTVIMMLKKNNRQISFLHVYHHSTILLMMWLVVAWAPGGEFCLSVFLNSSVHVVMYGYYLLSSMGIKQVSVIKYYITAMQMTQFLILLTQAIFDSVSEYLHPGSTNFPWQIAQMNISYMVSMLLLFGNFYIQDKRRIAKEKAGPKNKKE
ncbi:hypothetical protein HK100_006007 [Physocladia obscura]|uniref:Elongation of fatty acids protein n=1 Tax=Physocladia obscura TaxID=109957 RepID=A0AAD5T6I2_9FUNG|nr:hypothetical protein HK100_006007 [Physocladia obscura]